MARSVRVDYSALEKFRDKLEQIDLDEFCEATAKELAARLLRKVIKRTPVGDYSNSYDLEDDGEQYFLTMSDKQGGTLRRGWTTQLNNINVHKFANDYVVELINPVEYASYVEYGHRQEPGRYVPAIGKRLKKGWVPGQFMLTISENELRDAAPRLIEQKLNNWLKEALADD